MSEGVVLWVQGPGKREPYHVWTLHPDGKIEEHEGYSPELAVSIMVGAGLARMAADSQRPALARPQS